MSQLHKNICAGTLLMETPRTIDDLCATGGVEYLDGNLESIALLGTQLSEALISAHNGAAFASGLGGFASLQSTAHPFRLSSRRMTFQFHPLASVHVLNTAGRAGPKTGLAVSDMRGNLSLRLDTNGGYDTNVIRAMDCIPEPPENPRGFEYHSVPDELPLNVIPLNAVRSARHRWSQDSSASHLDAFCQDGGLSRAVTLPYIGQHKAWRVITEVLPSFLTYLLRHNIGFAPLVATRGFLFGNVLKKGTAHKVDSVFWIANGPQTFALLLDQVAAAWITICGPTMHLELYGMDGRAISALVPDRNEDWKRWNTLLASLPQVRPFTQRC
ncbi:MAG: hypothetical protein MK160_13595 [Rhodobacteraceae bacterium]|nr:hypothetical protein [Paracoccaceae bacterium]